VLLSGFTVEFFSPACRFLDRKADEWVSTGCEILPETSTEMVVCGCNHLTTFASEFFVPPNSIDFNTVFINLDEKLKQNFGVLTFLSCSFGVYIVLIVWARIKDKSDVVKVGSQRSSCI
jgi:polycystin 1L2